MGCLEKKTCFEISKIIDHSKVLFFRNAVVSQVNLKNFSHRELVIKPIVLFQSSFFIEIQDFMSVQPDTKIPIPFFILVTEYNIGGGVASDIGGYPNSISGNVIHYQRKFWVNVQDDNAYDCNILAGRLGPYKTAGLTDWDKALWQHELGHMMVG